MVGSICLIVINVSTIKNAKNERKKLTRGLRRIILNPFVVLGTMVVVARCVEVVVDVL